MTETEDNYGCILHTKCGGVVAPNMGYLIGTELLRETLDLLSCGLMCFKCGEEVKEGELEIEQYYG